MASRTPTTLLSLFGTNGESTASGTACRSPAEVDHAHLAALHHQFDSEFLWHREDTHRLHRLRGEALVQVIVPHAAKLAHATQHRLELLMVVSRQVVEAGLLADVGREQRALALTEQPRCNVERLQLIRRKHASRSATWKSW